VRCVESQKRRKHKEPLKQKTYGRKVKAGKKIEWKKKNAGQKNKKKKKCKRGAKRPTAGRCEKSKRLGRHKKREVLNEEQERGCTSIRRKVGEEAWDGGCESLGHMQFSRGGRHEKAGR